MTIRRMMYAPVVGLLLAGCGKVEEMAKTAADSARDAAESAKQSVTAKPPAAEKKGPPPVTATDVAASSPSNKPAPVDSARVMKEFFELPSDQVSDELLAGLAAIDASHREQIVELNLAGSPVSAEGLSNLRAFSNIQELNLTGVLPTSSAIDALLGLKHLEVLNLSRQGDHLTATALEKLASLPNLKSLSVARSKTTDEHIKAILMIRTLTHLDATKANGATEEGLASLVNLPELESLVLCSVDKVPAALLSLSKHKKLTSLDVSLCDLESVHLTIFRSWPRLTALNISANPRITDEAMVFLKPLRLEVLDLRDTGVGNRGFVLLGESSLKRLWFNPSMSDESMVVVKRQAGLQQLVLQKSGVTDQGIGLLKGLKQLEVLDITLTTISDQGLAQLAGMKSLKRLHYDGNTISEAAVEQLKATIPGLEVTTAPSPWIDLAE